MNGKSALQAHINYTRIASAIAYIRQHFKEQPNLDDVAASVHLSPFHFQRLFREWAGISPKKFLQYTSLGYAKRILRENNETTLFNAAHETGLSGPSRLHDLFVKIEGMTPAEYKNGGKDLDIRYNFFDSLFGHVIAASTPKGLCHMAFYEEEDQAVAILKSKFPNASFIQKTDALQERALAAFKEHSDKTPVLKLHLKGSEFQIKVWEALLKIPMGRLVTYGTIAREIDMPTASRAVGTAIGNNPVAFLIPCHRVIQASGALGGYMWDPVRKTAMIGWERAQRELAADGLFSNVNT